MAEIVNGVLIRDGQVLLARRSVHRVTYPDTWSFPGGHVEAGETLEGALDRELLEEIGIRPLEWAKLPEFSFSDGAVSFNIFVVHLWQGRPELCGDEHSQLRWVGLEAAAGLERLAFPIYRDLFRSLGKLSNR